MYSGSVGDFSHAQQAGKQYEFFLSPNLVDQAFDFFYTTFLSLKVSKKYI